MSMFKVLFIGDIVGKIGRKAAALVLPELKKKYNFDLVLANAENSAAGFGITLKVYDTLINELQLDLLTSGNHIWDKKETKTEIDKMEKLVRPLNYPLCLHGSGVKIIKKNGVRFCVINVMGRVFVNYHLDCPFQVLEAQLKELAGKYDICLVDIHAEATSEKQAFAHYFAGRVSAVIGTHTHVQTADEIILAPGTAYISDAGMVGAQESVLGMDKEAAIERFLRGTSERFSVPEKGRTVFNAVYLEFDEKYQPVKIERIKEEVTI